MRKGPKYKPGDKWYAGPKCNGYARGTVVVILKVIGTGKNKKLCVADIEDIMKLMKKEGVLNIADAVDIKNVKDYMSIVSYKTLWKRCKG